MCSFLLIGGIGERWMVDCMICEVFSNHGDSLTP